MELQCINRLEQSLVAAFPAAKLPEGTHLSAELCPPGMEGDITVNCFRMTRFFATKPDVLAAKAAELLTADPDVEAASSVKGFVNVTLKTAALFRDTVADVPAILAAGVLPEEARKRIVIEYSAPNTNKPQHLGHVRNNTLGMSLASLLARVKHDVIPVTL
ncbi:MAG: arginine--tRNA ligase, partial [Lentisphaerae bacterium]|nr:arginine--tRNA ligase [Lentisphaerota bacterium]